MKKVIPLLILSLFCSCSILRKETPASKEIRMARVKAKKARKQNQRVRVYAEKSSRLVFNQDTFYTQSKNNELRLIVPSVQKPCVINVINDSNSSVVTLKPSHWKEPDSSSTKPSNKPIKAKFPKIIFFDSQAKNGYNRYYSPQKHELYFSCFLLCPNIFSTVPEGLTRYNSAGGLGLGLGFDYYWKKNEYLSLIAFSTNDFSIVEHLGVDTYQYQYTNFVSISNNWIYKRFSAGTGLAFGKNTWRQYTDADATANLNRSTITKTEATLGLMFNLSYQFRKQIQFGVIYRPTFFAISGNKSWVYEHYIGIDIAFKLRLKK